MSCCCSRGRVWVWRNIGSGGGRRMFVVVCVVYRSGV